MVRKVRHYLTNVSKNIERNEERLRLISATLEHSTSMGHTTLKRRPSPNNSIGGSINSINALNNSSHNLSNSAVGISGGVTIGNGSLTHAKNIFGVQSPESYKKLLALSETKVKTVKNSSSSTSIPSVAVNNNTSLNNKSNQCLNTSTSSSNVNTNLNQNSNNNNTSALATLSPKSKNNTMSSSQPLSDKEAVSSTTTITSSSTQSKTSTTETQNSLQVIKTNTIASLQINGTEADSGRASMASNVDQDQCSPLFQQRAFILNKCKILCI
jgi:hypothetical protein